MKMSLCNSFRLLVVSCVVLSLIDTHAAFTLRHPIAGNDARDLAQEESVILEVKHDFDRPNDLRTESHKTAYDIRTSGVDSTTPQLRTDAMMASSSDVDVSAVKPLEANVDFTSDMAYTEQITVKNKPIESTVENLEPTTFVLLTQDSTLKIDEETLPTIEEGVPISSSAVSPARNKSSNVLRGPNTLRIYEVTKPSWKKYSTIERTRTSPIPPTDSMLEETTNYSTLENDVKSETKPPRNSLQDALDIASLEKLKIELLLTTQRQQQASENNISRFFSTEPTTVEQSIGNISNNSVPTTSTVISDSKYTVESKRAGYLDYSGKTSADEVAIATAASNLEAEHDKDPLTLTKYEVDHETDLPYEKTGLRVESQSQLNEDALKEQLLKEDMLIDNAEIAKRFHDDSLTTVGVNLSPKTEINDPQENIRNVSLVEANLKVKPINMNTEINTTLYPVGPNYKPLKKIDVRPQKPFMRDPDDNSWRNESLSSLGIVFKSKNSSKPFTQVLKNKTESELNKLIDKEDKNETPELRERLQKMTELRRSKKKKTDSLGNVVYFDYEENISDEKVKSSKEEIVTVTTPPFVTKTVASNSGSSEQISDITTSSEANTTTRTTEASFLKEFDVPSSGKPNKFFNVLEYYDNTEDDDADYLNMAKIDIKKHSTNRMSSTMPTIHNWSRPMVPHKHTSIIPPERKGTVQYFPPLTTQKVNINEYDTDFKFKVNSFTTVSEQPKHVIPVSTPEPTKRVHTTTMRDNKYKNLNEYTLSRRTHLYITRPPPTTESLTPPGDGRDGYVIKHYRDFVNQAAKDEEYDKNIDYPFITQAPYRGVTKTEFNNNDKDKSRLNAGDDYDYETHFRRDVLQRFVDNFNQNSHRFESDFPVLFNNSVIHGEATNGREIAASRAFMRGLYDNKLKSKSRPCSPECDRVTVELSPAYELHYYVPEQEERQEAPAQATVPYQNM